MKRKIFTLCIFCLCGYVFASCEDKDEKPYSTTESSASTITGTTSTDTFTETNTQTTDNDTINSQTMKLTIGNKQFIVDLQDNDCVKELKKLLPMTLNMQELNGNEKYAYLDSILPTSAYKPGTINKGDIMLYGNNCLVIFYKNFSSSYSYTKIGQIKDITSLEEVLGKGNITVKWE